MEEHAPDALVWLAGQIDKMVPTAEISGIVGDRAHTYGYHRARNVLPSDDYSRQLAADRRGAGDVASALDMKYSAKWMKIVTQRLIDSAEDPDDPRMEGVREFYGTVNGTTVAGRSHDGDYAWIHASSDDSHLWHVHISVLREYANNRDKMVDLLSVIKGDDDMPSVKEFWGEDNVLDSAKMGYGTDYVKTNKGMAPKTGLELAVRNTKVLLAQVGSLTAAVATLAAGNGADPEAVKAAAKAGAKDALAAADLKVTWE